MPKGDGIATLWPGNENHCAGAAVMEGGCPAATSRHNAVGHPSCACNADGPTGITTKPLNWAKSPIIAQSAASVRGCVGSKHAWYITPALKKRAPEIWRPPQFVEDCDYLAIRSVEICRAISLKA